MRGGAQPSRPPTAGARRFTAAGDDSQTDRRLTEQVTNEIEFFCVRPDHQTRALRETLTIHDEKWAYCPAGRPDGHAWRPYA